MPKKLLLIMADEHQAGALSAFGHPQVRTPNLDRLAARGLAFSNAWTPSPICVPARAALATGRYAHQTGYWDNAIAYDGRIPGWGLRLAEAGIRTASVGKLHYRRDEDPTGFAERLLPLHVQDGIGQVWGSVRDPLPPNSGKRGMLGAVGAGLSSYNRYDMDVSAAAADWIRAADPDEPWALFVSFVAPHFPLVVPQDYLDRHPPERLELSPLRAEKGHAPHPYVARMIEFQDTDGEFADDQARKAAMAAYHALCDFVDAQIGRVLEALEDSGQAEETLVVFCSDHGEMLGARNLWGKSVMYGDSCRIPLLMAGAGLTRGGRCATPVSLIDLPPTILDHFGLTPPEDWPGRSLLEIAQAPEDPERTVFSEYHAVASPSAAFMVADARWTYHHYVGWPPELFDLEADPGETRDLAADPASAEILQEMERRLRVICDPEAVDRAAKDDQNALIARFGGPEAAMRVGPKGASPAPTPAES